VKDSQISRISGQIDRNASSASAGPMNRTVSHRSVRKLKRFAAGGASSFSACVRAVGGF
jgi:hypothetical protein